MRGLRVLPGITVALLLSFGGLGRAGARSDATGRAAEVDRLFKEFTSSTPGCAVGVAVDGAPALTRVYGMADLEHDIPITTETIFEVGSVSKQFTAAAVQLLARDGKLSLDDPVRKYLPEVPDYGVPMTIRHLLTHTSGLRDWGSVEAIAGWPRTTRAYTHAHVLDIVSRQRALNFTPGTHWSYTNTGFNLAAIIVSRVAGMSFPEFTRAALFQPLGMTHTSWRDDYTRIVKGRAMAYSKAGSGFRTNMPFENVYGNGGLLTTVSDLLKWNEHYWTPRAGDANLVAEQVRPTTLTSDKRHGYGLGIASSVRRGVEQVDHGRSTAGYLAHLARYPDQHVSVAITCNSSDALATDRAYAVADLYLAERTTLAPVIPANATPPASDQLAALEGVYRNPATGRFTAFVHDGRGFRIDGGAALFPKSATSFVTAAGPTWEFDGRGHVRNTDTTDVVDFERVARVKPTAEELREYAGTYVSDEAETAFTIAVENGALALSRLPATTFSLTPVYRDAFAGPGVQTVVFRRDAAGKVSGLSVSQDRVWDLRFERRP